MRLMVIFFVVLLSVSVAYGQNQPVLSNEPPIDHQTRTVLIDLQNGFRGHPVTIKANDVVIYEGNPETDPLSGLAKGEIVLTSNSRYVDLRIESPEQGVDSVIRVDLDKSKKIGLSLKPAQVEMLQEDFFGYF